MHGPLSEVSGKRAAATSTSTKTISCDHDEITALPPIHTAVSEKYQRFIQPPEKAVLGPEKAVCLSTLHPAPSTLSVNACCKPNHPTAVLQGRKMGLSKSNRIIILLVVDSAFFLLELIVGYAVHSLALVADAFHMLNDVLSLCVGLWAVKVANNKSCSPMYTYGWQRAEILGALVNGVFLVALCLSIFLEAIQRFVEPQIVTNPKLVLIVGCLGLASNILGLLLFHDHGHAHGGTGHEHVSKNTQSDAEEGLANHSGHKDGTIDIGEEGGTIANALPQAAAGVWKSKSHPTSLRPHTSEESHGSSTPARDLSSPAGSRGHRRNRTSGSFGRGLGSVDHIYSHPAARRREIIEASQLKEGPESDPEEEAIQDEAGPSSPNEQTTLLKHAEDLSRKRSSSQPSRHKGASSKDHRHDSWHADHSHTKPDEQGTAKGGHGHSHQDLNMRGVFLHVLGDALGNIGVIVSALFIWLSSYKWRYYIDPAVSLLITIIILISAIPLCKAASRILLQAVPVHLSVDEIKEDIEQLPGIISCHHLHVWQLSDTKIVASLHIQVDTEIEGAGSAGYMHLARQVRTCLHGFGIHSSTIQPSFACNPVRVRALRFPAVRCQATARALRPAPPAEVARLTACNRSLVFVY